MLKKIFKAAKKAAPVIGAGLGFLYGGPALGGALSTGLGAGLGSLVGGRSPQESLRNALLGGAAGFGASRFLGLTPGAGLGGLLGGAGTAGGLTVTPGGVGAANAQAAASMKAAGIKNLAGSPLAKTNALQKAAAFVKANPLKSAAIVAGTAGLLGAGKEEDRTDPRPSVYGTMDPFRDLGQADIMPNKLIPFSEYGANFRNGGIVNLSTGGFPRKNGKIAGPGTETSDDIPAMLSDGEFVINAKTVRGLGAAMGGKGKEDTRDRGSKFLYSLQENYGGKA
tara:strand:- start:537 stop:1379 length:843 start_codon:yes stop_codon:yes gene_type:complete